jgi:hypothetical protein
MTVEILPLWTKSRSDGAWKGATSRYGSASPNGTPDDQAPTGTSGAGRPIDRNLPYPWKSWLPALPGALSARAGVARCRLSRQAEVPLRMESDKFSIARYCAGDWSQVLEVRLVD